MDSYSTLVSKVLDNQTLSNSIQDMVDENCLNLVTKDWKVLLENNPTYQNFSLQRCWKSPYTKVDYEYEELKCSNFQVVVVGHCKFTKPYAGKIKQLSIIISNSEPLNKLAQSMTSDLGSDIQISNEFKFSFTDCSVLSCDTCREYSAIFAKAGYKLTNSNQPCIADTKVFDGKNVVNRFSCHIQNLFNKTFVGVLRLNVNVRYSFMDSKMGKSYRISGQVLNMIAFAESKLTGINKKIDVGNLTNVLIEEITDDDTDNKKQNNDFISEIESLMTEQDSKRKNSELDEPSKKLKIIEEEISCEEDDYLLI